MPPAEDQLKGHAAVSGRGTNDAHAEDSQPREGRTEAPMELPTLELALPEPLGLLARELANLFVPLP